MKCYPESLNQRSARLCISGLSQELGPWRLASEDSGLLSVSRIQEQVLLTFFLGRQSAWGPRGQVRALSWPARFSWQPLLMQQLNTLAPQVQPGYLCCDSVLQPPDSSRF